MQASGCVDECERRKRPRVPACAGRRENESIDTGRERRFGMMDGRHVVQR